MRTSSYSLVSLWIVGSLGFSGPARGEAKPASSSSRDLFAWGQEVCVIYDYRPLLSSGKSRVPYLFAIERKNVNGGIFEKTYDLKMRSDVRGTLVRVMGDAASLVEKGLCHSVEVYYPTKEKMDAPM